MSKEESKARELLAREREARAILARYQELERQMKTGNAQNEVARMSHYQHQFEEYHRRSQQTVATLIYPLSKEEQRLVESCAGIGEQLLAIGIRISAFVASGAWKRAKEAFQQKKGGKKKKGYRGEDPRNN